MLKSENILFRLLQNQDFTTELEKACNEVFKYAYDETSPLLVSHANEEKKLYN